MRDEVINLVAAFLTGQVVGRKAPFRVAVDGRTASGKTTIANELAATLSDRGLSVLRLSIDGFHKPRAERYKQSRTSPTGYLDDARDWEAIRRLMLEPLGPGGNRVYRSKILDLETDQRVQEPSMVAEADAVVIVDGSFLRRHELRGCFECVMLVDVSRENSILRGAARDAGMLGDYASALSIFEERYARAYDIYLERLDGGEAPDVTIDNNDFAKPVVKF
ncbi:uridylate kinase [Ensifer sp. ENS05]|uniref:uridylate kinase n=1 Tax=Ensifer sp. ENS05 TaxID=2769277 RepID=UPI0017800A11|nr:uridylate kinase [Ensifer sp. ENS05]MBD9597685.1 uridylate kinase [Ensifer sp. ENS05]